jgi:hypothetical protein
MRAGTRIRSTALALLAPLALLAAPSQPARALVMVDATVFPLDPGGFRWELSIGNPGPDDVVLVSLLGAPLGDPAIGPSLETPAGYLASYDGVLGFVDFLEDTALFGAGTTVGGFAFVTSEAPTAGVLDRFESLSLLGTFESGDVAITIVPEAQTGVLVGLGLAGLVLRARRKEGPQ